MRPIKFRAWDDYNRKMEYGLKVGKEHLFQGKELMQYSGLRDKNGREIYEGDIVRCWKKHSHIDEARDELVEGYATAVIKANGWTFFFEVIKQDDPRGWFFYGPEADEFYGVCTDYETMEVIGNIYENPELLGPTAREDGGK